MLWQDAQLEAIDQAVSAARAGRPTVLSISGDAGLGKSSLLQEVVRRASGFTVLDGDGEEGYSEPFMLLRHLGVDDVLTVTGAPKAPLQAAQGLREVVDAAGARGPVLLVVDDLQWADRESVEALYWLFHRAAGDRLLVAVGTRPRGADSLDVWRRLVTRERGAVSVELSGLSEAQALALAGPDAPERVVRRLREHTGGSPLYLRSLLSQYDLAELDTMRDLPAPAEITALVQERLAAVSTDAVALLQAAAVLGHAWTDVPTLGAVAEVGEPTAAVEVLLDAGLLVTRSPDPAARVRTVHALVRAAVYQSIPLARRRALHRRAAAALTSPMAVLEHRVAATDRYDDDLADELDAAARTATVRGDFRQAGYLYRWASGTTEPADLRARRWLDSLYAGVLARDLAVVRRELPDVEWADDLPRRALVQGALLLIELQWRDALTVLTSVPESALAATDPLTRYRLRVLAAHCSLSVGGSTQEVAALLDAAAAEPVTDASLDGYLVPTAGQVALRRGADGVARRALAAVPAVPRETPATQTFQLAWRASLEVFSGMTAEAEADLAEVTARIRGGVADPGGGIYHGILAYTRWQAGSWDLASVEMGVALDSTLGAPHPMVRAVEPLLLTVRGELARADERLQEMTVVMQRQPWPEAVYLSTVAQVVRLHAGEDAVARQDLLPQLRRAYGSELVEAHGTVGAVWMLHMALAAVWAGEPELAERHVAQIERLSATPRWPQWGTLWLRGLAAEARGRTDEARALLDRAVAVPVHDLPLYRAHLAADLARLARAGGDARVAERSQRSALEQYRRLGAVPYVERLSRSTTLTPAAGIPSVAELEALTMLSDRERDVVTLLVAGLSYAQIARDLYVTRSTVGFHLTNIYAKTGVSSRHDLTDLVRGAH